MDKFQLDEKGQGMPPSFPGKGSGGSHVSNYGNDGAFVMATPPVGMNKPIEAHELVDSTKGMKMRNDLSGGEISNPRVMPSMNAGGATHNAFESLSTDGQGRGVAEDDTSVEMFAGTTTGAIPMNPASPRKAGGSQLKGYS